MVIVTEDFLRQCCTVLSRMLGSASKARGVAYQTAPCHISESRSLNRHIVCNC